MRREGLATVRKEQILSAAALVVDRRGFERATMRNVASVAGVSTGLVNHYFDNREDLLSQTLVFVSERNLSRIRDAVSRGAVDADRLRALVRSSIAVESKGLDVGSRVWISALSYALQSPEIEGVIRDRRLLYQSMIRTILRPIVDPKNTNTAALETLSAEVDAYLHGISIYIATGEQNFDPTAIEDRFLHIVNDAARQLIEPAHPA